MKRRWEDVVDDDDDEEEDLEEEDRANQRRLEEELKKQLLEAEVQKKRLRPNEPEPPSWFDTTSSYISSFFYPPTPAEQKLKEKQEEANELLREIFDGDYNVIPKKAEPKTEYEKKLKMAQLRLDREIDKANLLLHNIRKEAERDLRRQQRLIRRLAEQTRGAKDLGKDIVGFGRHSKIRKRALRKGSEEAIAHMKWVRSHKRK